MKEYTLKENEVAIPLQAFGIHYVCEFCKVGHMMADAEKTRKRAMIMSNMQMIVHVCDKCGKEMSLPQIYPKIEWAEIHTEEVDNEAAPTEE